MSDKELIAMCDCPEIQDRWQPKVGDVCCEGDNTVIWLVTRTYSDSGLDVVGMHNKDEEGIDREALTYIPRIEDVLEWLVPKRFKSWVYAHSMVREFYYSYDMAIKGWLAMVMKINHNKSWNGEAWV